MSSIGAAMIDLEVIVCWVMLCYQSACLHQHHACGTCKARGHNVLCMQLSTDQASKGELIQADVRIGDVYALLVGNHPSPIPFLFACLLLPVWHQINS